MMPTLPNIKNLSNERPCEQRNAQHKHKFVREKKNDTENALLSSQMQQIYIIRYLRKIHMVYACRQLFFILFFWSFRANQSVVLGESSHINMVQHNQLYNITCNQQRNYDQQNQII